MSDAKNNPTPAGQQYDAFANDIARLLDVLGMELEAHRERAAERNWARVGDLEKVRSDLINTLAFISRKDRPEIEAFLDDLAHTTNATTPPATTRRSHPMSSTPNRDNFASIQFAKRLSDRRIEIQGIEARTPDGRVWSIVPLPPNHGRRADGSWGPVPGLVHGHKSGFRLFEIDERKGPQEHDAVEGDTWGIGDLLDYLEAIGQVRN